MIHLLLYGVPAVALLCWAARLLFRPSRRRAAPPTAERSPERIEKERELLARLERLKRRTDDVAAAVDRDPARAAKAVRAMMKGRTGPKP